MNTKSVTLVTYVYDLKKLDKTDRPTIEGYLENGKYVCSMDYPMVIYTDADLFWSIFQMRKNFQNKTLIIIRPLTQFKYYPKYEAIEKVRKNVQLVYGNTAKDTVNYILLMWEKFGVLEDVVKNNPFQTTHFAWIDFGISHVAHPVDMTNIFENIPDKIKLSLITDIIAGEISDPSYGNKVSWVLAGGFFTGNADYMTKFIQRFDEEANLLLEHNNAPLESNIMTLVVFKSPDLFDVYFGDYYSLLTNYHHLTEDIDGIMNRIISHGLNSTERKYGFIACEQLHESWEKYNIHFPPRQMMFLHSYYVLAYYIKGADFAREIAKEFVNFLKEEILKNSDETPEYKFMYTSLKDFFNNNFMYVGVTVNEIDKIMT